MSSGSASEGEIVESDHEKATTAPTSAQNSSVNRRLRDALSPSPVASPRSPSPSGSRRSRNRSRSPYRASRSPRGEKRRRLDDDGRDAAPISDTRRFKVHYEDRSGLANDRRRGYNDHDRTSKYNARARYDERDDRDRYGSKGLPRRSRSPEQSTGLIDRRYGHRSMNSSESVGGSRDMDRHDNLNPSYKQRDRAQHLVSDRETFPTPSAHSSKREAETRLKSAMRNTGHANGRDIAARSADESVVDVKNEYLEQKQSNDILSADERRKRREAIKAKYKTPTTPLLVQALQQTSAPGSPGSPIDTPDGRSSRSGELHHVNFKPTINPSNFRAEVSPDIDSPNAALEYSNGSPPSIDVADDAELANDAATVEGTVADEPSAADYDPTMDMQEDRARIEKRLHTEDIPAGGYDEMQIDRDKQVLLPENDTVPIAQMPSGKAQTADDMFASDDEDDMFAPVVQNSATAGAGETNLTAPLSKAKELDMSLLDNWDDHEGYYRVILGELLEGRYHVQSNLGKGMFSGVVRALDTKTDELVAIKIIRNNETMIKAGQKEMDILQKLADTDPGDKKHLIRLKRSFNHKGHLCMVFENLSINLREVLKKFGRDIGINLKAVRSYAQQMFLGLGLLRKCNILHADLKPDNILVNEARNMLKICDLGSAADASENDITPYLVSRFYRAPEIILGIPYDFAIDMWSIGCTLFEMYTGKILFTGRTNNQMLRSIMECRGKFSLKMLKKAEFGAVHFDDQNLNFRSMERDTITGRDVVKLINFVKPTRDLKSRLMAATAIGDGKRALPDGELKEINLFADLLDRCLALNPEKRISPSEALKHPFIHRSVSVVGGGKAW